MLSLENLLLSCVQVNRILKVAKPNIVVMKLLAGGHKKDSKVRKCQLSLMWNVLHTGLLQLNEQTQATVTLTFKRAGKVTIHFSLGNSLLQLFKYGIFLFLNVWKKKWEVHVRGHVQIWAFFKSRKNTVGRVLVVRISRCHVGQREERAFRLPAEGWTWKNEGAYWRGTPAIYSCVPITAGGWLAFAGLSWNIFQTLKS